MRNRSTMVYRGPTLWLGSVSTPDGTLLKFKGDYKTEHEFRTKILEYFSDEPDLIFNIKFLNVRKTSSYKQLDNPSVIEV